MRLQNTVEREKETKKLLEENLRVSKATLKIAEKTRKYIFWSQVVNWLKLILIITPIILAILYLPSFIEKWREKIQDLFPFNNIDAIQQFQGAGNALEQFQK